MAQDDVATVTALDGARQAFKAAIEGRGGRIVDMAGDSVLALFETARGAVDAAIDVQATLARAGLDVAADRRMHFRIGIHLGDVIEKSDGTVYGDGVNIASRLEGLAAPGGIVVSQSIHTAVQSGLPAAWRFEDIGDQAVKNIAQPVRAFRSVAAGAPALPAATETRRRPARWAAIAAIVVVLAGLASYAGWQRFGGRPVATASAPSTAWFSIVVLPFANLSGDPGQAYVADGLTASVTADLSRIRDAFVVSAASAQAYRDRTATLRQIGSELGVRFVLQGNVQRAGDRIRVNAQLGETATDAQLWTDTFEGDATNLFALQDLITTRIGNSVGQQLVINAARASEMRTSDPTVADLLLRAAALGLKDRSEPNSKLLVDLNRKAFALEPENIEVMSGLAFALINYAAQHMVDAPGAEREKLFDEGRALALKVRGRDPQAVNAWIALGVDAAWHGDNAGAQRAREARLALQPQNPGAYANLANSFIEKEPRRAVELLTQAYDLNPRRPPDIVFLTLGEAYFRLGEYDHAIEWLLKDVNSNRFWQADIYAQLALCYAQLGDVPKAQQWAAAYQKADRSARPGFLSSSRPAADAPASVVQFWNTTFLPAWRLAGLPDEP